LADGGDESSEEGSAKKNSNKNPLVAPCECDGSAKHIHIDCLREWLKSKATIRENNYTKNYIYKVSKCELCQTAYPDQVLLDGRKYEIYEIDRPKDNHYLVMEVLGMPSGKNLQVLKIPNDAYV